MKPSEESLEASLEKTVKRLKHVMGHMITLVEPLHALQRIKWENMMMRAEVTALRDIMKARGQLDTAELQKRTKDYMEQYASMVEAELGIQISDTGVVTYTGRSQMAMKRMGDSFRKA